MNFMFILCAVAISVVTPEELFDDSSANTVNSVSPRIGNGNRALIGVFPWFASLEIRTQREPNRAVYCGGAILNQLWIITSADCLINARSVQVFAGSVQFRGGVTVTADSYYTHPSYTANNFANNLALLRIRQHQAFNFTNSPTAALAPIRLPSLRQENVSFNDEEVYFQGFGYTAFGRSNMSDHLLFTKQRVISNEHCRTYFSNNPDVIRPTTLCAYSFDIREGPCNGDGGGPLATNEFGTWTLLGTLSFLHSGGSCGRRHVPAAFTRLTSRIYVDWIRRTANYQFRP